MNTKTQPDRRFSNDEFMKMLMKLQIHHTLFYHLWELGRPTFDSMIPTAQVGFDKEGMCINFKISPEFWDTLDETQKLFVIGHECLHVALDHGLRGIGNWGKRANKMMDIVVNHTLINQFGFKRFEFDPDGKYCWIDTCFGEYAPIVEHNQSFEYYFALHKKLFPDDENGGSGDLVDDHSEMTGEASVDDILKQIKEKLSDEEQKSIQDIFNKITDPIDPQGGTTSGGMTWFVPKQIIKKKKKWETVIKNWSRKYIIPKDYDIDQWATLNRRMVTLKSDFCLPSEMEIEDDHKENHKIQVWFFQDTSASCKKYINRFFKAAESLPPERFDIKMHCFDTEVYETTLESRELKGFGGTTFNMIETYIQSYITKNKQRYPEAVFVITDGYSSDSVKPFKPKNWHWFLTPGGEDRYYPKECNTYKLENYE